MRIISLDVGEKSLGICISDSNKIIAIPLENYIFPRYDFDNAVEKIINLTWEYNDVDEILVGFPLKTTGERAEITELIEIFLNKLSSKLSKEIKIKTIDERFSTQRGIELLKNKFKDKDKIKELKDLAASYVMLYDYLNRF